MSMSTSGHNVRAAIVGGVGGEHFPDLAAQRVAELAEPPVGLPPARPPAGPDEGLG